ncbi:MAG: TIGR02281 family clan AA aspartic protease [Roseibium sp.]|nr:TIGR02281 family clan AA aspartic protease [Roseibium sp.]
MPGPKAFRGFAVAVLVAIMAGAAVYAFVDWPTSPEDYNFDDTGPRIVALTALAVVFMASLVFGQPRVRDILRAVAFWGGLAAVLVVGYTYRDDLLQGGYRVLGALAPGLAVPQQDGSILVVRDASGHFVLRGRSNGAPMDFLLDTGASAVVLTAQDARRAGFSSSDLSFSVPVSTANGRTMVAPIRIETLDVGDARFRNIRAFVAREGSLDSNLLGMTALDRLQSWRIEGDRLIMVP